MNMPGTDFSHEHATLVQFVKYSLAGGIATIVHMFVFHLAAWKAFPALRDDDWAVSLFDLKLKPLDENRRATNSMIDNGIAFIFSNLVAYMVNAAWVFVPGRTSKAVEISRFFLVSAVSTIIGTSLMGYFIRKYRMKTTYAFIAYLVTSLMINYVLRKHWVFNG